MADAASPARFLSQVWPPSNQVAAPHHGGGRAGALVSVDASPLPDADITVLLS